MPAPIVQSPEENLILHNPPRSQWILQERLQFMEKMGDKRRRKVKGCGAATKDAAAASEGVQKLLT